MSESDPTVRIWLAVDVRLSSVPGLVQVLGQSATADVRIGQGEFAFMREEEYEALRTIVSKDALNHFYQRQFDDDTASSLGVNLLRSVATAIPSDFKQLDKDDKVIAVARPAWDVEARRILSGESSTKLGPKKRNLLIAFTSYLPSLETDQ